jgi:hypothetical protein
VAKGKAERALLTRLVGIKDHGFKMNRRFMDHEIPIVF